LIEADRMQLYWLCYRQNNHISVIIEPGSLELRPGRHETPGVI
jgi:hypothetical protein